MSRQCKMKGNKVKSSTIVALAMLCMALIGCRTPSTGGVEVTVQGNGSFSMRIVDGSFAKDISVEDAHIRRGEDGFAAVEVLVRNQRKDDLGVVYKYSFFEADGMSVKCDGRSWEQKVLHGGELGSFTATGPEPEVAKFVLQMCRTY